MTKSLLLSIFFISAFSLCPAQEDTIRFSPPQKLTDAVNSSAEESLPIISTDGSRLYLARTFHPDNKGGKYGGQDIWISEMDGGNFGRAKSLKELNDEWSNVVVGASADGKKLYLLNQRSTELETVPGVSVSTYDQTENRWGPQVGIQIPELEILGGFYGLFVDANESFMLWSLPTSEADSLGNDLFVSVSTEEGWSAPQSLGAAVNTDKDEISPFFDANTGLLFFSTNGRGSGDDYDLYYAKRMSDDWQDWSLPVKADINSTSFDAYFFLSDDSTGYFSSNRGDSLTNIYVTHLIIESATDEIIEEDTTAVTDQELEVIVETGGEERKGEGIRSMSRTELLDEETVIRFVYFEYDKYNITARYVEVLDDVASILDTYPDIYVKIEGHTDAVASDAYNQILSENRAASVKEWLVINGIDPDRVKTEGLGEREPYASNATEEGRAQNRRVEIFFREMK